MLSTTWFTSIKLVIVTCIVRGLWKAEGLSRLMGQLSRAVLRGGEHVTVFLLPDAEKKWSFVLQPLRLNESAV